MYTNELYHHGVKGMRWGHRKAPPTSTGTGNKKRSSTDPEAEERAERAGRAIAKSGGSKGKAIAKKILLTELSTTATSIGSSLAQNYLRNNGMEFAASVLNGVTIGTNVSMTVRGVKDVIDIAKH